MTEKPLSEFYLVCLSVSGTLCKPQDKAAKIVCPNWHDDDAEDNDAVNDADDNSETDNGDAYNDDADNDADNDEADDDDADNNADNDD